MKKKFNNNHLPPALKGRKASEVFLASVAPLKENKE